MEEAAAPRRDEVHPDREASRRLADDRHVLRVSPERRDVVPHPLERELLILEALIAVRADAGVGEPAEVPQPVVDADDHDPLARREHVAERAVVGLYALAEHERSAVDP